MVKLHTSKTDLIFWIKLLNKTYIKCERPYLTHFLLKARAFNVDGMLRPHLSFVFNFYFFIFYICFILINIVFKYSNIYLVFELTGVDIRNLISFLISPTKLLHDDRFPELLLCSLTTRKNMC